MRVLLIIASVFLLGCGAACAAEAVPATSYFPVLPFGDADETLPQMVPVAVNHSLEGTHAGITRAIIIIHDESRDANSALAMMSALGGQTNSSTLIIAPQFLLASDVARFADHLPEKGHAFATWQMAGWVTGDDSIVTQGRKGISSFTVVDLMLMVLSDHNLFPDLKVVTVAGSGAGATFVQRYAAFGMAAEPAAQAQIEVRYLLADTPSYLYLTPDRPLGGSKGFGPPAVAACPAYNAYPYGLDVLNPYARRVGANAAKMDYALQFTTYLNAIGADPLPDSNCAALFQGADGTMRALHYALYLQSLYGGVASKTQKFLNIPNTKNDAVGLFGSACGMATLFGDGMCGGRL